MRYRVINLNRLGQASAETPAPPPPLAPPSDSGPRWVNEKSGNVGTTLAAVGLIGALAIGAIALLK